MPSHRMITFCFLPRRTGGRNSATICFLNLVLKIIYLYVPLALNSARLRQKKLMLPSDSGDSARFPRLALAYLRRMLLVVSPCLRGSFFDSSDRLLRVSAPPR